MNTRLDPVGAVLSALLAFATPAIAQNLTPAQAGFSAERLQRIDQFIERKMAAGEVSGGVTLVARNGRIVHLKAQGVTDVDSKRPMQKDSIFRIASMSKPVAAVAVLMLQTPGQPRTEEFETVVMQALVD